MIWYDIYMIEVKLNIINPKFIYFLFLQILLLGAEEGLFSYRLKEANAKPVRIQGLTHVHQMSMLPLLNCLIILAGIWALLKQSVDFAEFVTIIVIWIFQNIVAGHLIALNISDYHNLQSL